jgi:predicted negative regulator of RcsB-dependent stress response
MSTCLSFIVAFLYTSFGLAQPSVDFERAKKLLDEGKYTKAMHLFKDVSTSNTLYSLDASYLCGVAAYHDHRYADARFILTKICNEAPNYKNIDEVYFLLSRVAFEEKQYFKALKYLETIDSKSFIQDIRAIKKTYLKNVSPEQMMALQQHFQSDKVVAEIALSSLEKIKSKSEKNKLQIEYLKQEYSLRSTSEKVSKKAVQLNVAVLLAFYVEDAKMRSES